MQRRNLIVGLSGLVVAWPDRPHAQGRLPVVGFLGGSTPALANERVAAFEQRLKELGWTLGRTLKVDYRWSEADLARARNFLSEFVRAQVNVIVTHATENVIAAKQSTTTIPIVFAVAADPVGTGLVASLAKPGGNATGLSIQAPDLAGKRLSLLREVLPRLRRLGILFNAENHASVLEKQEVERLVRRMGLTVASAEIRQAKDIAAAVSSFMQETDAIYGCADPVLNANRNAVASLALEKRLPLIFDNREFVIAGALMSYGPNIVDLFRRAADYVDKILKGAKVADLPVQQPTKFDLVVNQDIAKQLGLVLPPSLLARVDEVIG